MNDHPQGETPDPVIQATIARQVDEIQRLRRQLGEERFAEQLRDALALAATTSTIASPIKHNRLLEMIVQTGAHVIGAQAASLFLIDQDTQELIFEVALGQKAEEVKKFRVPLGHGIAGLVAVSGQPMAISDAQNDPRQASNIAQSVGYVPKNILCVPLFVEDEVIGVLELLDKLGTSAFTLGDMEALGYFANIAAVAIEQSRTNRNLAGLVSAVITASGEDGQDQKLRQQSRAFVVDLEQGAAYQHALDIAQMVQEIVSYGEYEATACRRILTAFVEYLRLRPQVELEAGGLQ